MPTLSPAGTFQQRKACRPVHVNMMDFRGDVTLPMGSKPSKLSVPYQFFPALRNPLASRYVVCDIYRLEHATTGMIQRERQNNDEIDWHLSGKN